MQALFLHSQIYRNIMYRKIQLSFSYLLRNQKTLIFTFVTNYTLWHASVQRNAGKHLFLLLLYIWSPVADKLWDSSSEQSERLLLSERVESSVRQRIKHLFTYFDSGFLSAHILLLMPFKIIIAHICWDINIYQW